MDALILIIAVLVAFDLAALRWGTDSRPPFDDEAPRNI